MTHRFFDAARLKPGAVDKARRYIRSNLVGFAREVERYGFDALRITGGEPTLRAHLPRLIALLAPLGADVAIDYRTDWAAAAQARGQSASASISRPICRHRSS